MGENDILKNMLFDIQAQLDLLYQAVNALSVKSLEKHQKDIIFDGLIKRFDNLLLNTSKLLGLALAHEGIHTLSPRAAIQEAVRINWINDPDFWLLSLDARNQSINGNITLSKNELNNLITQFGTEVEVVINLLKELFKIN